jgi:L-lactate dehydrogenase complex protein LldG
MSVSPSKEAILKKIRKALTESTPLPFVQSEGAQSFFQPSQKELEVQFAESFTQIQGKFAFCLNSSELALQLEQLFTARNWNNIFCSEDNLRQLLAKAGVSIAYSNDLANCDASITGCAHLVARTGSIVLSTAAQSGRTASVYAPIHICIAFTNQLVYDLKDALQQLREKPMPSFVSFASGPSRTADIEKTLVTGVHGPKEVYCFLVDQP